MAQFPTLKTGAVAQYPMTVTLNYRADVVAFFDGSEQRYRNAPSILHQWKIPLNQLDEAELASVQQFFIANQGGTASFAFTDPTSGVVYSNCSVVGSALDSSFQAPLKGKTTLTIRENRT